jgi:predicted dehydrogenase
MSELGSPHQIRLAIVGAGKIARDRHLPAVSADGRFQLVATADAAGGIQGVAAFGSLEALLASGIGIDAVSICTPPAVRHDLAALAIESGLHVLLEKPPAATLGEALSLVERARRRGRTLLTTWHAREGAGVESARRWLRSRQIRAVRITWCEDIRHWHPGQDWLLEAGGFGVFDPGINALSIATRILPDRLMVLGGSLAVPENRQAPIAAKIELACGLVPIGLELDFRHAAAPCWMIEVETDAGLLKLEDGGRLLSHPGRLARDVPQSVADRAYGRLYARFARLVATGRSEVDLAPLQIVADIFLRASRTVAPPFHW